MVRALATITIFILAVLQTGCGLFGASSISSTSIPTDADATGDLSLPSRIVVNNSPTVEIELACGGTATEFLIVNTQVSPPSGDLPALSDGSWQTCPAATATINAPVTSGQNELQIWFKSPIGISPQPQTITAHRTASYTFHLPEAELGANNYAAKNFVELSPTLFAVADPNNDVNGADSGAVHILNLAGEVQRTLRGRYAGDRFGSGASLNPGIIKLSGNRFAVISPYASVASGAVLEAGQVAVYDYEGTELYKFEGDNANDRIGSGGILLLSNANLLLVNPVDDVGGLTDAGSIVLLNGNTGAVINKLEGDVANDRVGLGALGAPKTSQLSTGLIMIPNCYDSIFGGLASVGSVHFMNPDTGVVVSTIQGDNANDGLGTDGIDILSDSTVAIRTSGDDVPSYSNGGSVTFVNPATGAVLSKVDGGPYEVFLGQERLVELTNGNVVIYSGFFSQQGRAILVDGTTYATIATIVGSHISADFSGQGVIALTNGNFVVFSEYNEPTGVFSQGSATLVNGTTGAVIAHIAGDLFGGFQLNGVALKNGNFVVVFPGYGASDQGRMQIVNGTTGAVLNTVDGNVDGDIDVNIEWATGLLPNGNFLFRNYTLDVGGLVNAGCEQLYNGTTGALLNQFCGDEAGDSVGGGGQARVLTNGNILSGSSSEKVGGVAVGRVRLIDGTTGALIQTYDGGTAGDAFGSVLLASDNGNAAIVAPDFDSGGIVNAGRIMVINGSTGAVISTINGETAEDKIGGTFRSVTATGDFLFTSSTDDVDGKVNSGSIMLIDKQTGAAKFSAGGPTAGDGLVNSFVLSNGDYVLQASGSDSLGVSNSGAYILIPMD